MGVFEEVQDLTSDPFRADGMNNQGLQYHIHDESDELRFELAGRLSKGGAQSVYQAWQTALSILGDRP